MAEGVEFFPSPLAGEGARRADEGVGTNTVASWITAEVGP